MVDLAAPAAHQEELDDVLGDCDKLLRSSSIAAIAFGSPKTPGGEKYHVTPSAAAPEALELLGPLTANYIRHNEKFDGAGAEKATNRSPLDQVLLNSLAAVKKPLMLNLLAAIARNNLKYETDPQLLFDEAIVRLTVPFPIDDQIAKLDEMAATADASACQKDLCKQFSRVLHSIEKGDLTESQAKTDAEMLLKSLPDDPYREQALYFLADTAKSHTVNGIDESESEKNLWRTILILALLILMLATSPVFAVILWRWFFNKSDKSPLPLGAVRQEIGLSPLSYGWKKMWSVVIFLIFTLFLVLGFELLTGAASEFDTIIQAIKYPILCAMNELTGSVLFNSTVFFVYFVYCLPHGLSFKEAFGLRLSTPDYSFKRLISLGGTAYLALNLVTSITLLLLVIYHHPETPSDQSASVARTLSLGAGTIFFVTEALMGPLLEELCFRGVLYRGLRSSWGILPSVIVSSLWFALLHGDLAPWLLFHKFAVGAVNALLYEKTKSITPAIVAHCLNNMVLNLF